MLRFEVLYFNSINQYHLIQLTNIIAVDTKMLPVAGDSQKENMSRFRTKRCSYQNLRRLNCGTAINVCNNNRWLHSGSEFPNASSSQCCSKLEIPKQVIKQHIDTMQRDEQGKQDFQHYHVFQNCKIAYNPRDAQQGTHYYSAFQSRSIQIIEIIRDFIYRYPKNVSPDSLVIIMNVSQN